MWAEVCLSGIRGAEPDRLIACVTMRRENEDLAARL
jgi:hypothetical protein